MEKSERVDVVVVVLDHRGQPVKATKQLANRTKRSVAAAVLKVATDRPSAELADASGLAKSFVRGMRRRLEDAGVIERPDLVLCRDGIRRPLRYREGTGEVAARRQYEREKKRAWRAKRRAMSVPASC